MPLSEDSATATIDPVTKLEGKIRLHDDQLRGLERQTKNKITPRMQDRIEVGYNGDLTFNTSAYLL